MATRKGKARPGRAAKGRKKAAGKRPIAKRSAKASRKTGRAAAGKAGKATRQTRQAGRTRRPAEQTVPTPPSSLDLKRRGSAARSGRAELSAARARHRGMSPELAGGDADVDLESAYFTGDESAGGDNPTPDQDVVEDIGRAVGVEYQDNEELDTTDKVTKRDKHRWELDPASSEDYKDRS